MVDDLTWDAILQAWPWFGAAAVVFVIAVGSYIALRPKPKRQPETAADAADNIEWTLTRRIDLADPQLAGAFVLEVEEFSDFHEPNWRRTPRNSLAKSNAT